jgi:hypothetical protein
MTDVNAKFDSFKQAAQGTAARASTNPPALRAAMQNNPAWTIRSTGTRVHHRTSTPSLTADPFNGHYVRRGWFNVQQIPRTPK